MSRATAVFLENCSSLYGSSSAAEAILIKAGIDPTLRGEALQIEAFCKIAAVAPDIF